MATLQTFGGGTTDFILDPGNGAKPLGNAPYTVIDGVTMLPASGLTDANGIAVTQLTSDADGRYAGSALLEGSTYWLDCVGSRGPFRAGPQVSTTALAEVVAMGPQLNTIAASAAASAFSAKQAQAAAEAVQTGAATTNASLLTTGTVPPARLPDLSGTYATVGSLAATQAQQDALATVTPTIDELVQTCIITAWGSGATPSGQESVSGAHTIWVVPFPCKIVAATVSWEYWNFPQADTNYWGFDLYRLRNGTGSVIVDKNTSLSAAGAEAVTARRPWRYAGSVWNAANATLAEGDLLQWRSNKVGTPAVHQMPVTITFRYVPL